ncbi:MAG: cryptochrome/photolyase family protein [Fluviicola sp.]
MKECSIIFPHQLFEENPCLKKGRTVFLVEEELFFNQYNFHKTKLVYHRASMQVYAKFLKKKGYDVRYISAQENHSDIRQLILFLASENFTSLHLVELTDNWLTKRLTETAKQTNCTIVKYSSPLFLTTKEELIDFRTKSKRFFQADFYQFQRKKWNILLDEKGKPVGGKWSFDEDNRKKYPKDKIAPEIQFPKDSAVFKEAKAYVELNYSSNCGEIRSDLPPVTFSDAKAFFQSFLNERFAEFGAYEDAIVYKEHYFNHSYLTPMLNVGLITPKFVLEEILIFYEQNSDRIPLNSMEGFIRQIIGWREFIRMVYVFEGSRERTTNFWNFKRKIPKSFYNGTTGILPIDETIQKILKTGYCHHIERLMVLGNFFLLCEFDPDEVYRWFMELFIDAYDWVMVPNVYGMSQFADGGLMSTKPYLSGSAYLKKMSDYPKGEWEEIWDSLYWNFIDKQRTFFVLNPRLGMMVHLYDKMNPERKMKLAEVAENWFSKLDDL